MKKTKKEASGVWASTLFLKLIMGLQDPRKFKPPCYLRNKTGKMAPYFLGKAGFSLCRAGEPAGLVRPMGSTSGEL
jgi:hypothetical protein